MRQNSEYIFLKTVNKKNTIFGTSGRISPSFLALQGENIFTTSTEKIKQESSNKNMDKNIDTWSPNSTIQEQMSLIVGGPQSRQHFMCKQIKD